MYEGQELNHAFGLCHYKHFLFWNEYRSGSIYKLDTNTMNVTLLRNERPPIFEIRVYDAQQQQGRLCFLSLSLPPSPFIFTLHPLRKSNTVWVYNVCVYLCVCVCVGTGTNACKVNNGGCSSLCLAIPDGRSCGCADDQVLDADNVTCKGNQPNPPLGNKTM